MPWGLELLTAKAATVPAFPRWGCHLFQVGSCCCGPHCPPLHCESHCLCPDHLSILPLPPPPPWVAVQHSHQEWTGGDQNCDPTHRTPRWSWQGEPVGASSVGFDLLSLGAKVVVFPPPPSVKKTPSQRALGHSRPASRDLQNRRSQGHTVRRVWVDLQGGRRKIGEMAVPTLAALCGHLVSISSSLTFGGWSGKS